MKAVLAIAGFDPSGCAGILVDAAVIRAFGFHPAAVITVLTYQNTCRVSGYVELDPEAVGEQVRMILEDLEISGIKIGLICSREVSEELSRILSEVDCPTVLDPVIESTTGFRFSSSEVYEPLLKACDVVTPNAFEASEISGVNVVDFESAVKACRIISERFGCSVVVTGGSLGGVDVVWSGELQKVEGKMGEEVRGTGCAYSAALTCCLARGMDLRRACEEARRFVEAAASKPVRIGGCFGVLQITSYHP